MQLTVINGVLFIMTASIVPHNVLEYVHTISAMCFTLQLWLYSEKFFSFHILICSRNDKNKKVFTLNVIDHQIQFNIIYCRAIL